MPPLSNNREPIAITGIAPMYPGARTVGELATADHLATPADIPVDDSWFDPAHYLGQRKFKYLTKATRYALAAAGEALSDAGLGENTYQPEQCGAIVGTNFAVCDVHREMDEVVLHEGAMSLSPMDAANFSVNLAASHISLRYGFRAFNACLTSSIVAGAEAIVFAAQAIRRGRCALALAGATEDRPPAAAAALIGRPVGSGSACLMVLEPLEAARQRGAKTYAVLGEACLRFMPPAAMESAGGRRHLECILREYLDRVTASNRGLLSYCPLSLPAPVNRAVDEIVTAELERRCVRVCRTHYAGSDGSFMAVSPVLQAASAAVHNPECLLAATSHEGHIVLLTLHSAGRYATGGTDDERRTIE